MKKSALMKILSTILKKRKRKPRKPKTVMPKTIRAVPSETVRQQSNIINNKPVPIVPDLNRELIREFGEYKKERFQQPDERNNAPSEINLYKEFLEYKTMSPTQFKEKISSKYNELQKVQRQKEYNKLLLEEAKQQKKEEQQLAKEEEVFSKKMAKIKVAIPRKLKEQKAIRIPTTIENKIIPLNTNIKEIVKEQAKEPTIIIVEDNLPDIGFELDDNDGLQSAAPTVASEQFIAQQPQESAPLKEQPILKITKRGRPKKSK